MGNVLMGYIPYNFENIMIQNSTNFPSEPRIRSSKVYKYWFRSLLERLYSRIEFENLPWKGQEKNLFLWVIFRYGYGFVGYDSSYGTFFQPCNLGGDLDFNWQPNKCFAISSKIKKEWSIGEDCELVMLTRDYQGVLDIVDYYACKLAELSSSVDVAIANTKVPYILGGKNKSVVNALKKIVDKAKSGFSSIFFDSRIMQKDINDSDPYIHIRLFEGQNDYITSDLLQDVQTVINSFDCEIGIPTSPYQKNERLTQAEGESKKIESYARIQTWVDCLNDSFEKVNAMFGLNIHATINMIGGEQNESSESNDVGLSRVSEREP